MSLGPVPVQDVVDVGGLSFSGVHRKDYRWSGAAWAVGIHETCHPSTN